MATRSHLLSRSAPPDKGAAVDLPTLAEVPSPSQVAALPPSSSAFSPAPAGVPLCPVVAAWSPIPVPPPIGAILQRPADPGRVPSVKRLCTSDELLRTSLEVPSIRLRTSPAKADVEGKCYIGESAPRLLMSDYWSCFWLWVDGHRFLSMIVMGDHPSVNVRTSRRDTALGARNRCVAS